MEFQPETEEKDIQKYLEGKVKCKSSFRVGIPQKEKEAMLNLELPQGTFVHYFLNVRNRYESDFL